MLERAYDDQDQTMYEDMRLGSEQTMCTYNTAISQMTPDPPNDNLPTCAGCGTRILDRYFLLVAEQHWHAPCLRCVVCNTQLDSEITCFARDGNIFCKQDYYRRYALQSCARCHLGVSSQELVMRARDLIFHLECFTCASCNKTLPTGDTFGIYGDEIFCLHDYEMVVNNFQNDDYRLMTSPSTHELMTYYTEPEVLQKGRPRKRKHLLSADGCLQSLVVLVPVDRWGGETLDLGSVERRILTNEQGELMSRDGYGHSPRQKRVRTSFKHHQLRTMKSYFALNHNPDAKDLKALAQKTQLSKRVLQVWFQNARAKYRRSQAKFGSDEGTATSKDTANTSEESEQLLDLTNRRSPALSDVSSNQSVTDSVDMIEMGNSGDSINDLFSDGNSST